MRVWNDLNGDLQPFRGGTLTLGKFDGLHLGHQRLLEEVQKGPGPRLLLTFDPHPMQVLRPELGVKRIFPREDLSEQLPCHGLDLLVVLPFTKALATKSAMEFAEQNLAVLSPSRLVVGYDFAFGRNREGDLPWLRQWCQQKGMTLTVAASREVEGEAVSSRRIRQAIETGDVVLARHLLGRPFYLRGPIVRGAGRGRGLGFPTVNMEPVNETRPGLGVYWTRTRLAGRVFFSVTNVGRVPTFTDQSQVHVETHLLDAPDRDFYGESADVEFLQRLRPEKKFASVADLKNQIEQDILKARDLQTHETLDVHKPHQ